MILLHDEQVPTCPLRARKEVEARIIHEGAARWKQQLEETRLRKLEDQKKVRDLLEKWPWGQEQIRPRGLRNLRLEGLFPDQDFRKAKRQVGTLDFNRPGGGAPNINEHGYRMPRTREDPMLRFQWGNDMRRTVDNTIRYKTNKENQMQYKKDLDKLVADKKKQLILEKLQDKIIDNENGWSNPETLTKLANEKVAHDQQLKKGYNAFLNITMRPPNQIEKHERVIFPTNGLVRTASTNGTNGKCGIPGIVSTNGTTGILKHRAGGPLSPLRHDGRGNGVELVKLLAEKRTNLKIPLGSTDVTRDLNDGMNSSKWNVEGGKYLKDLDRQMTLKLQQLQNNREIEIANANRHFSTWDGFWGRPGHGAPRTELRKGCLDQLLYPKFQIPVAVA